MQIDLKEFDFSRNFLPEMKKNDFVFPSHMTDPRIYILYTSVAKISFVAKRGNDI